MINKDGLHSWVNVSTHESIDSKYIERSYCQHQGCNCIRVKNKENGYHEYIEGGKIKHIQPICTGNRSNVK